MLPLSLSTVFALLLAVSTKGCPTRSSIKQSLLDAHIPGAAVVVVNATDILYQEAFGHQSLSPVRMMDVDKSIFVLASISKTFIAVAVMQLVESNQLELDADINQYLFSSDQRISHPLYPSHFITLRQLLSHSASISNNFQEQVDFMQPGDSALTRMSLADACFTYLNHNRSNWLSHPPGSVTLYSNIGAALPALIVERVTQMSYEHYVKDEILKPLGIDAKKAGFRLSDIENREDLVKHYAFNASYLNEWDRFVPQLNITQIELDWLYIPFFSLVDYPAGLLRMSAKSLSLFLRMFMNNGSSLLHPRSIVEMQTVISGVVPYRDQNSTSDNSPPLAPLEYGLVWNWQTMDDGRRFIGHRGAVPGTLNMMLINEQGNLGVIILSNGDISMNNALSRKIYDTLTNIQLAFFDCYET